MRVLLSAYGSRGLRALGAEGFDALAAGGMVPAGVWR